MVDKVETAVVKLWGDEVGAVSWLEDRAYGVFEYDPGFLKKGLDISPIHMGLDDAKRGDGIYSFPGLNRETFVGLPGLLADSLPDKFGNRIIEAWLVRNGRDPLSFSPVERLCYTGRRAMGALELLEAAGVRGVLNFASIKLKSDQVIIQNINIGHALENVIFSVNTKKIHR